MSHNPVIVALLALAVQGNAQVTTSAVCTTDFWTVNHQNQSPCLVAAALEGACNANNFNIPPLQAGNQYGGPWKSSSNVCECNTVAFSMVAACGACQGGNVATWDQWIFNCSTDDITLNGYPLTIPSAVSVPHWAFLHVVDNGGIWDATAALTDANKYLPDVAGGTAPTTAAPGASSVAAATSTSLSSPVSASKQSNNAGAIAGGVVGGVVFLALLGLGAFFFFRYRKSKRTAPSAQFVDPQRRGEKVDLVGGAMSPPLPSAAPSYPGFQTPVLPLQDEPPRLYDPSDPSTFPSTPAPSGYSGPVPSSSSPMGGIPPGYNPGRSPVSSVPYSQTSAPYGDGFPQAPAQGRGYHGAPEV